MYAPMSRRPGTQLKSTQAQAIDAGVQRAQLEHAIAVLLGKAPADFSVQLPKESSRTTFPTESTRPALQAP